MSHKLTIKDIAKHAGVGTTTVSRVLNEHPYVSEEKRQKVLQTIEELDYRPNYSAKSLRSNTTTMVGFLTDEVATTPFAVDIIRGAQEAASKRNHVLLVVNTGETAEAAAHAVEFLLERQVAGIIYAAHFHRAVQLPENIYQVPTVLANCYVENHSLPSAVPDEFIGGYNAIKCLLEAGHRRIGFFTVSAPAIDAATGRLNGYKHALAEYNIPYDESLVLPMSDIPEENYDNTIRFLEMENPVTAIFAGIDRMAIACYTAIAAKGLRIPDDVAVVGFDNQAGIGDHLIPALTTIQLPHYKMGEWAFNQLFVEQTEDRVVPHTIDCPIVFRNSV